MNTRYVDEYLKRLKDHERFFKNKLQEKEQGKSHYLMKELIALQWIIKFVEDNMVIAAEHQSKMFKDQNV